MDEYINRTAAVCIADYAADEHPYSKERGKPETYSDYNQGWNDACDYIRGKLENAPAADVEYVIRCKDCKYSRELNHEDPKERQFIEGCVWCMNWEYGVFPDDYCSNAKRRKDNA